MSAKIGQAKSTGGKASTYYARQYFVALLFLLSVVQESLLEMVFSVSALTAGQADGKAVTSDQAW